MKAIFKLMLAVLYDYAKYSYYYTKESVYTEQQSSQVPFTQLKIRGNVYYYLIAEFKLRNHCCGSLLSSQHFHAH